MANQKAMYSYLVAVQVFFTDTGATMTARVNVDINFRITKATVDALMQQIKETLSREDLMWRKALADPHVVMNITAFSRYEDE